jgi:hypothetical protein
MKAACPRYLALALLLLTFSTCQRKKADPQPTDPTASLPPATQTGQRTFGCLLNGQPWTQPFNPTGGSGFETQYQAGNLLISCPRVIKDNTGVAQVSQTLVFRLDSVYSTGTYCIIGLNGRTLDMTDFLINCNWAASSAFPATLQLTRLDLAARIVSGTFSFTLETPGCGPVAVTAGRFDTRF